MDRHIDFASRPTAAYVITSVVVRDSLIPGLRAYDIQCEKPGARRRLVIHSRDGDDPVIGYQLIHQRLIGGFAPMWSNTAEADHGRLWAEALGSAASQSPG
jgi:hypothetical protein